jgi:glycosyltransferase involved in cell wall biosynthesis
MSNQVAPVSCFIRALNEEPVIGRTIAAVRDFVAEIVVVDAGSTDATIAIAQAAGARVIHQSWLGSGRQKRFAEDQCHNDFLLDLDADEVASPDLAVEIRTLFAAGPPPQSIYELKLVTVPPVGKPWTHAHVRFRRKLYDRRVVRAPDHRAWDQFDAPPNIRVGRLFSALHHYSFRDFEQLVDKLNRTSSDRVREGRQLGRAAVTFRILFAWPHYFFKAFVLRGLFRLGAYGVAVASISAFGRWMRDVKMYERILVDRERLQSRD